MITKKMDFQKNLKEIKVWSSNRAMRGDDFGFDGFNDALKNLKVEESSSSSSSPPSSQGDVAATGAGGLQLTICFTDVVDDVTLYFQIIRFPKQIYAWIGCNSAKFGNLYAAALTHPDDTVGVTSILGGASDNAGAGIARRLVLKCGLNVILASNIPKNSPAAIELSAETKLVDKLISLGYAKAKTQWSR